IILLTFASCSPPATTTPKDTKEGGEAEIMEAKEVETAEAQEVETPEVPEVKIVQAGTEEPNSDASEVIISLGEEKLTMQQIKWVHPSPTDSQIASLAKWWLENELLYIEAEKRGIADEPRAKFLAELMRKNVFQKELVTGLQDAVQVTDETVLAYYEKNKGTDPKLMGRGYLGFSHVRTKTLEQAQRVLERIKAGEKIDDLAKEVSVGADARKGGAVRRITYDLTKTRFGTKFFEAIMAAKEGEVIGPIEVKQDHYEVARKDSETKPAPRPFEELKGGIKSHLERTEKQKVIRDLLDSLMEKAADKMVKSTRLIEAEKSSAQGPKMGSPTGSVSEPKK
ncbi:MAG: peptidyl-prolyl cis-trans isomerase, partial [Planctomycetota bacterium]